MNCQPALFIPESDGNRRSFLSFPQLGLAAHPLRALMAGGPSITNERKGGRSLPFPWKAVPCSRFPAEPAWCRKPSMKRLGHCCSKYRHLPVMGVGIPGAVPGYVTEAAASWRLTQEQVARANSGREGKCMIRKNLPSDNLRQFKNTAWHRRAEVPFRRESS